MAAKTEKKINPEKRQKNNVLARRKHLKRKIAQRCGLSVADYAWKDGRLHGRNPQTGEIIGLVPNVPAVPKFPAK